MGFKLFNTVYSDLQWQSVWKDPQVFPDFSLILTSHDRRVCQCHWLTNWGIKDNAEKVFLPNQIFGNLLYIMNDLNQLIYQMIFPVLSKYLEFKTWKPELTSLTHLPVVPHICVSELGHHWFRFDQAWTNIDLLSIRSIWTNLSEIRIKNTQLFTHKQAFEKCRLQNGGHYVQREMR